MDNGVEQDNSASAIDNEQRHQDAQEKHVVNKQKKKRSKRKKKKTNNWAELASPPSAINNEQGWLVAEEKQEPIEEHNNVVDKQKKKRPKKKKKKTNNVAEQVKTALSTENEQGEKQASAHEREEKKKPNKNKKKNLGNESETLQKETPKSPKSEKSRKRKPIKKRPNNKWGEDRYFGRFSCRICRRSWESCLVFTIAGTKKVKYQQRCRICVDGWEFPVDLDLIRCSICKAHAVYCKCTCEDCGKLIRVPRGKNRISKRDLKAMYCVCDKRNLKQKDPLGEKIDLKKPHPRELCGKCLKTGRNCWEQQDEEQELVNMMGDLSINNEEVASLWWP